MDDSTEMTRADVTAHRGPLLLEFGTSWCGFCRALAPIIKGIHAAFPQVEHRKVEDGPGQPLGRSFRVTLWPTLVFLQDGQVVRQMSRPGRSEVIEGFRAVTETEAGVVSDRTSIDQAARPADAGASRMQEQRTGPRDEL